jgi:Protein of unknown function (DUF4058)
MPSPFPGIDPYLESPDWFPGLHANLIVFMKGALQRSLPESYEATQNATTRFIIDRGNQDGFIWPAP